MLIHSIFIYPWHKLLGEITRSMTSEYVQICVTKFDEMKIEQLNNDGDKLF